MNEFWKDIAIPNLTSLSGYLEIWLTFIIKNMPVANLEEFEGEFK